MAFDLEFLLSLVEKPAATFVKTKLQEGLQKFHDSDLDGYNATVLGAYAPIKILLEKVASMTKTDVDDVIVEDGIVSAIEDSMKANGLAVPVVPPYTPKAAA